MSQVLIQLDEEQQQRVRAIADAEQKSEHDVYREAISAYLVTAPHAGAEPSDSDYEPLLRMLAMVDDGPVDMSAVHDVRPTDPV